MAKKLSTDVIEGAERLLIGLMEEAALPEREVIENGKKRRVKAIPFAERLRLVTTATTFLQAQFKIGEDLPAEKSAFEKEVLDVATRPETRGGARRRKAVSEKEGFDENGRDPGEAAAAALIRDPLASTEDERYIPVNGHPGPDKAGFDA